MSRGKRGRGAPLREAQRTPRREKFIIEFQKDMNATQAALRAGYSPASARQQGSRNLRIPWVAEEIAKLKREQLDALKLDAETVLRELTKLCTSDITKLYDDHGNLLPMREWPEEMRGAVSGVETVIRNLSGGDDQLDEIVKVKTHGKVESLKLAMTHLGLLTEKVEVKFDVVERLKAGRARVALAARNANS